MIFGDRRAAAMAVCLAGLESTVLAPLSVWAYGKPTISVLAIMLGLWGLQCLWTIIVDVLNSMDLGDAAYRWHVLAAILVSTLLLIRAIAYPSLSLGDPSWLAATWAGIFRLDDGISLELLTCLVNVLLWQRALTQSGSHMPFLQLSQIVRWLWTAAAFSAWVAATVSDANPLPVLISSFPLGLLALLMARADEKESNAASIGPAPALSGSLQFLLIVLTISALGILPLLTTANSVIPWVEQAFSLLLLLALQVVMLFVFLIYPLVLRAVDWAVGSLGAGDARPLIPLPSQAELLYGESAAIRSIAALPPWAVTGLRIAALLLLVAALAGFVMLLGRVVRPHRRAYTRGQRRQKATAGESLIKRGLGQLQEMLALARRIGIGQQLLAAISVQNIYANLSRLASARDHPRKPYQPPDRYLQELVIAFGGHEEALQRITDAYMQVHYGDHDITRENLRQIQVDYHAIRGDIARG